MENQICKFEKAQLRIIKSANHPEHSGIPRPFVRREYGYFSPDPLVPRGIKIA
jgi:hypothetical protein